MYALGPEHWVSREQEVGPGHGLAAETTQSTQP